MRTRDRATSRPWWVTVLDEFHGPMTAETAAVSGKSVEPVCHSESCITVTYLTNRF